MEKNHLVQYPRVPGHKISAEIEQIGPGVPATFQKGQKVTVVPYTSCGQCSYCKQKKFNACRYNQTLWVQRDGAMAKYITIPWQKVIVDDALTDFQLALAEPMTVGFHAVIKYFKKNSNLAENILISKVVSPLEAPDAMREWSDNPGRILKILVKF